MTAADTAADIATSETSVTPLPSSTPASRGVDSRRISEFLDAFEAAPDAAADAELAERLAHLLPTAVSGGWTDPDTLRVDVLFLETPHRMYVTCDIPRATVEAHFVTEWLANGPVTRLRAPLER